MKKLIACCGLDCEKCNARIATVDDNNALREETAQLWSELNQVQITPEMINCMGCRTDGVKTPYCDSMCEIRICAMKRGFNTCGSCPDMADCEVIKIVVENSPDALHNLTLATKEKPCRILLTR